MGDTEFNRIRSRLLGEGRLYEDPYFQAIPRSVYYSKDARNIRWRRPTEICNNPKFIVDGATRFDLDQGGLGDCWYIAAAATLTTRKEFFQQVVPLDQGFGDNYAGIFHFRFWRFGKWEDVIIDDKLPVDRRTGQLLFCKNRGDKDEFWSALMEKAYAKVHGSYEALDGGYAEYALVDFTGGLSHRENITKHRGNIPDDLFDNLCAFHVKRSLLGSSISATTDTMEHRNSNGLVIGHAYSITKLLKVQQGDLSVKLVRLRNPWGRKEWNGPWSDGSKEWMSLDTTARQQIGLVNDEDGEFWMSFNDWINNFENLQTCHVTPDAEISGRAKWNEHEIHSKWVRGVSAGGCGNRPFERLYWNNPQFSVRLTSPNPNNPNEKTWIVISLMQKPSGGPQSSCRTKEIYCAISFGLYKVKDKVPKILEEETYRQYALELTERRANYECSREVTRTFYEEPGTYVIIPSTFRPGIEREFLIRVYSETEIIGSEMDTETGPIQCFATQQRDTISGLFGKHCGQDNAIDAHELQNLLNEAFAAELSLDHKFELEACRSLLCMMDTDKRGRLEYEEVQTMWKKLTKWQRLFKQFDQDNSGHISVTELKNVFHSEGFNVSRGVLEALVRRYADRHDRLPFNDFIIAMCKLISLMAVFTKVADGGKAEFNMEEFMKMTLSF